MAKKIINPVDPKALSEASQLLSDIATKLDNLKVYENIKIDLQLPGITDDAARLEKLFKPLDKVEKSFGNLGKSLKEVKKRQMELRTENVKLKKELEKTKSLIADPNASKDTVAKATIRQKELETKIKRTTASLKKFNDNALQSRAISEHTKKGTIALAEKGFGFLVKTGLAATTIAFGVLEDAMLKSYKTHEKFRGAFAAMAMQIGAATPQLEQFQETARKMYFDNDSLGAMGMDITQITGEVGAFVSSLEILDKSFLDNQKTLITHGRVLGLTGQEMGDTARTFMLMGQNAGDLDNVLETLNKDAKILGVSSSKLAKNVLVLGKNLLALAGPKFQDQMIRTIEKFTKMGVSIQSLERFTDMTDTFDQAAASMAKLNTVFGTHINALQLFATQDPAKRFEMITDQMKAQGIQVDKLTRQEKKFMADTIGITVEEVNAMLSFNGSMEELSQKMQKAEKDQADWASGINELKSVLVTWGRIVDRVMQSVMKAAAPLLAIFGIHGELGNAFQTIGAKAEEFMKAVEKALKKLEIDPEAQAAFKRLGETIQDIGRRLLNFIGSADFPNFITSVLTGLDKMASAMGVFVDMILAAAPAIMSFFGFIVKYSAELVALWVAFKGVGIAVQFGLALMSLATAAGTAGTAMGALGAGIAAAFWPILAIVAAVLALVAAGYGLYKLVNYFSNRKERNAKIKQLEEGGMSHADAEAKIKKEEQDKEDEKDVQKQLERKLKVQFEKTPDFAAKAESEKKKEKSPEEMEKEAKKKAEEGVTQDEALKILMGKQDKKQEQEAKTPDAVGKEVGKVVEDNLKTKSTEAAVQDESKKNEKKAEVDKFTSLEDATRASYKLMEAWHNEWLAEMIKPGSLAAANAPTVEAKEPEMETYAKGGRFDASGPFLVGEKGPEVMNLDRPGTITPNNELKQLNGGDNITHVQVILDGQVIQDRMYKNNLRSIS